MERAELRTLSRGDVVAEALEATKRAGELRQAAIKELLVQLDQINQNLKALGYVAGTGMGHANGHNATVPLAKRAAQIAVASTNSGSKRFKGLTLADIGKILLTERETLHGKDIESAAKAGGFKGGSKNFQNYLPVAFKRAGGFENIGKNVWKLNAAIPAKR